MSYRRLVALLALAMTSCSRPPTTASDIGDARADGTSDTRADRTPDAPVLPWVSTFAGSSCGVSTYGHRLEAIMFPRTIVTAPDGRLYVAEQATISVVDGEQVLPIAGTSIGTPTDGPAATSVFNNIMGLAIGSEETIYVAEKWNVRMLAKGFVTTLAGLYGAQGHVDGLASQARFYDISSIDVAVDGSIIIGETKYLRRLQDGFVTTIAGSGKTASGVSQSDGPALDAMIHHVLALRSVGDAISFLEPQTLRSLSAGQVVTLGGASGWSEPSYADGPLTSARFSQTISSLVVYKGVLYIADRGNNRIRKVENGIVTSLTNGRQGLRDGPLADAEFGEPISLTVDAEGNLYVADLSNCRIRMIRFR
jgi:hypothetical protein